MHASIKEGLALVEGRASRRTSVLANAGIAQGGREGLGRIRNVSTGGMCIQTSLTLVVGQPASVTFQSGAIVDCEVRWVRNRHAGLSCDTDPRPALGTPADDRRPALPRFNRQLPIELAVQGRAYTCTLDSISTCDILATDAPMLVRGQLLSVAVDGLALLPAVVRISAEGELYARFSTPLAFAALDAWLARDFDPSRP